MGAKTARRRNRHRHGDGCAIDLTVQERTLHLVDIENLLGDPWATGWRVGWALEQYLGVAGWRQGDLVYLAANPYLVRELVFDLPVGCNARAVVGRDGADLVLLANAAPDFVVRRAGRLVVGSGDHIFAARAAQVAAAGVEVLVVARPESLSWQLAGFPYRPFCSAPPSEPSHDEIHAGVALAA